MRNIVPGPLQSILGHFCERTVSDAEIAEYNDAARLASTKGC